MWLRDCRIRHFSDGGGQKKTSFDGQWVNFQTALRTYSEKVPVDLAIDFLSYSAVSSGACAREESKWTTTDCDSEERMKDRKDEERVG